jgi:hypothetical protein
VPMVHADGTTSDGGFVKKLVIQDVPSEDGKGAKQSMLWAGMEITDSELQRKLAEKSIRGVSGGVLFDYERTEDAKKFDQVLSHVMVTNSPWINGTGDFHDKLPEGVMASEAADLPMGEVELASGETDPQPQLPAVRLADPPARARPPVAETAERHRRLEARAGLPLPAGQGPERARGTGATRSWPTSRGAALLAGLALLLR